MSKTSRAGLLLASAIALIALGAVLVAVTPTDLVARDTLWLVTGVLGGSFIAGGIALVGVHYALRLVLEGRGEA